jgi:hypothetical protein
MDMESTGLVTTTERVWLRELARRYMACAQLPVMAERTQRWYGHNALQGLQPMVVMETNPFNGELLPPLKCTSPFAQDLERRLLMPVINHELVDDDKVVPPWLPVYWKINRREFDRDFETRRADDGKGRFIGFLQEHPLQDLEQDLPKLARSVNRVDRDGTLREKAATEEILGDLLPVQLENNALRWRLTPSEKVVRLMGMESMLVAMMDQPELMQQLYGFIVDDVLDYVAWQEREGLLTPNNGNHYAGAGSYGFTHELPAAGASGVVRPRDLWANLNSQETVTISPAMFGEMVYPHYHRLAEAFGLVYYGCCEPVHDIWEAYVGRLPNLRKVSVSAWCDEDRMGQYLRGGRVIYSRKPSPNFVGVGTFDEAAFGAHIARTLRAAQGCSLEIIFRDIYTLDGDISKPGRAVRVVRRLVEKMWR